MTPVAAVFILLALLATAGAAWIGSRPEPVWTDVYKASVVHVVGVELPAGGIRQEIPEARGVSSIAIPYRLWVRGPARVMVTVVGDDGREAVRRELRLERTDIPDGARLFRPADPFGRDTELLVVHFPPVESGTLRVGVAGVPGTPPPWLLETQVGNTDLPEAAGTPGLSVSVLLGYGEERWAAARLPVYLDRMAAVGPRWMSPPVFAILFLVFVALGLAALRGAAGSAAEAPGPR